MLLASLTVCYRMQTPIQLFDRPHPQRLPSSAVPVPVWDDIRLMTGAAKPRSEEVSPEATGQGQDSDELVAVTLQGGNDSNCAVVLAQWRDEEAIVTVDAQVSARSQPRVPGRSTCGLWFSRASQCHCGGTAASGLTLTTW